MNRQHLLKKFCWQCLRIPMMRLRLHRCWPNTLLRARCLSCHCYRWTLRSYTHAGIPAGDSLAAARTEELKCAAKALGIKEPIMFGLHDQLKMQGGFGPVHDQLNELRTNVKKLFEELKPDAVITWGASGWTGHHDHRLVGSVVTEVFEAIKWEKPAQLFYPGIPTGKLPAEGALFATMDSVYLTTKVTADPTHYDQAMNSLYCHASQYTREQMDQMRGLIVASLGNVTWFKPHHEPAPKQGLF